MIKSKSKKAMIFVNLDANEGRAALKWSKISHFITDQITLPKEVFAYHCPFDITSCLHQQLASFDIKLIISAGGDGTANYIVNKIMELPHDSYKDIQLGFVGLGSSNDLLKPANKEYMGVPYKIDTHHSCKKDLGKASFTGNDDLLKTKFFLSNSSIGVGANANHLFNTSDLIIRMIKPRFLNLTIIYTILKAILQLKNFRVKLTHNEKEYFLNLSYLVLLKNPHISGKMKFDQVQVCDDGYLGLNFCENMNKRELIRVLRDLQKGVFSGKPKRHSNYVEKVIIELEKETLIEFDGDIERARTIYYSVLKSAIQICQ